MKNQKQKRNNGNPIRWKMAVFYATVVPIFLAVILLQVSDTLLNKLFWFGAFPVASVLLTAYILGTLISYVAIRNKDFKIAKTRTKIFEQKDKLFMNYNKYRAKNTALTIFVQSYLWSFYFIVIILNTATLVNLLNLLLQWEVSNIVFLPLLVLAIIFGTIFLGNFFIKTEFSIDGAHMYLPRSAYPQIWDTAIAAKIQTGIKGNLAIFAVPGANIGIMLHKKMHILLVGFDATRLLSQAELYSIFLHEFGHVINKDYLLSHKRQRLASKLERLSARNKFYPTFLFIPLFVMISKNFSIFSLLTSYISEQNADKIITKTNDQRNFINAIAKMDLYNIWQYELPKQNFCNSEAVPKDYFEIRFNTFESAYLKNKQKWDSICLNQLEARIDTHPNLPERMKTFGIYDFFTDFSKDPIFDGEIEKIRESLLPYVLEDWDTNYKNGYLRHKETVLKWQDANTVPIEHCIELANAYFELCDYDNALKYYDIILAKNATHVHAIYRKGLILCDRYDDAGIDFLYQSISNTNFGEIAFLRLGMYLQYMGLANKRAQIRDGMYSKIDWNINVKISKKFKIHQHTIPQDIFYKIRDCIRTEGNIFSAVYLANKHINNQSINSLFLCFKKNTDENSVMLALRNVDAAISIFGIDIAIYAFRDIAHMGKLPKMLDNYNLFS